jgi:Fur family ferric uptake transcriptional regulator
MTSPHLMSAAESRLREHGVRPTPGRRSVIAALAGAEGPRSAAELYGEMGGSVALSSLYRSLKVLEESGVAAPHLGAKGLTRYELAEWLIGHHHHLVCVECGTVDDVEVPEGVETVVAEVIAGIAATAGFEPAAHIIEIEGRCAECR